ncbi:LPS export ABC transporter permease LptG [bacterium AH-315-J19]|nr:LPS export ABC transporter permease LptG [Robiginitomaculum sp.]MBN4058441.1 LPS export ABC transporter permease LptG [bacterium AH-315-J19]
MPTLNKYIATRVLLAIIIAFMIITGIIMLVDFVEASRNLGSDSDVSMLGVLYITLLNAPMLVEQTVPFVVLFGVMGALFALNRRSELIVMRASGLSAWRFLRPALLVTALLGVVWATVFNPLASISQKQYRKVVDEITAGETKAAPTSSTAQKPIWLREGNDDGYVVIHALSADIDKHTLFDVTFYTFDIISNGRNVFSTRYDAKQAVLSNDGYWQLSDIVENEDGKEPKKLKTISKLTTITWDSLKERSQTQKTPPFWQIRGEIDKAKSAGFSPTTLVMQWHKLLALPLTLIAMAVIAAGASLNMAREGGTLRLLIAGAAMGFGVYFVDNLVGAFGETGVLPPVVAAWTVPLLVLSCGLVFLSWIEDG